MTSRNDDPKAVQTRRHETIGLLAGGIAHDFGNMLSPIIGYSDLLRRRFKDDPEVSQWVEAISRCANRAASLIGPLLALGRGSPLHMKSCDMNDIVDGFFTAFRRAFRDNIEMTIKLNDNALPLVADPIQIQQLLLQLAISSQESLPMGGHMNVTLSRTIMSGNASNPLGLPNGEYAVLQLADNGVGIPQSLADRIFDPDFVPPAGMSGLPMNLAPVLEIARTHHGSVTVKSAPNAGAIYCVYLPLSETVRQQDVAVFEAAKQALVGKRILAVDDEPDILDIVEVMLQDTGATISVASTPEQAISTLQSDHKAFDILLTDVVMPRLNGRFIADHARKLAPSIKVCYMTGYSPAQLNKIGIEESRCAILSKPFDGDTLIKCLGTLK